MDEALGHILRQVQEGTLAPGEAAERVRRHLAEPMGFATIDHDRSRRCGAAEVVFAAGKTPEQVVAIARAIRARHPVALVTRAGVEHVAAMRQSFDAAELTVGSRAGTVMVGAPTPVEHAAPIPIITAGTSDESVAEEAELTVRAMGQTPHRINDVGVAGLHRLNARLPELREAAVIVCIAGMEGALPSVVGGLVDVPVIAVPTSVGYGAALGGIAALLGMLTSCASGVTVVNIDNGFGAAYTACMINRRAAKRSSHR
ncbi:MAG: nickel pincer cofactor biosynthesis protein LarB [Planctomycetes bacterium]|nr:nickel pincer cofactor biosynthesis protein LarB [Planctomycetota bacterium]